MAWYTGTYACGHAGKVNVVGKVKDREWKVQRHFSNDCEECRQKKYEEKIKKEQEEAALKASKMELPELEGTEKQVVWAITLRQKLIDKFDKITDEDIRMYQYRLKGLGRVEIMKIKDFILKNRVKASYYIDNRHENLIDIILLEKEEALREPEEKEFEEKMKLENTVFPEEKITNKPAEIKVFENKITVEFEKNDTFRKIVKSLKYTWNGNEWERDINERTGTSEDRAAELGNKLLNAGIPICVFDENVRKKSVEGDFKQECTRWILWSPSKEKLVISWEGYDPSLYKKAKSLPGAKYSRPDVLVSIAHFNEVEEFAELFGFEFSKKAKESIEAYKREIEKAETVIPKEVEYKEPKDGLKEILESSDEILDDLKD